MLPKPSSNMTIRELQKRYPGSKPAVGRISPVNINRAAYYSTDSYLGMQVAGSGISESLKAFIVYLLVICSYVIAFHAAHSRRFLYYKRYSRARLDRLSCIAAFELYCLPRPFLGHVDVIDYILAVHLYGFGFVGLRRACNHSDDHAICFS